MNPPRRILIVKPSSLGDVLHTLPVVSAIHRHWPEAEIRWLIHPAWRVLVENHSSVSETILFPREKFRGVSGWLRSLVWMRLLRDWKPDLAIDLQGLFRSALFARISGATRIIGLSDAREGARYLLHEVVPVDPKDHAVNRYLSILDHLNIPHPELPEHPEFELPQGKIPLGFNSSTPYIVLHPYARGEGKSLNPDLIRAFIRGAGTHRTIILGKGEPVPDLPPPAEDWSNRTDLLELIGILRGAAFIVSSDSGPMHLAAVLHPATTLAIHRWSDPLKVGPYFPESLVWKGGRIARVAELDEGWRPEGRIPTESEMEKIGGSIGAGVFDGEGNTIPFLA
jgi:ADP-heptose:LPS heptosyltransferase